MPSTPTAANPTSVMALFPDGSSPEERMQKLSALCSFGHTQLVMTGAIRQILMQHFVDPQNVLSASLRAYLEREGAWTADTDTGLMIESIDKWRPELTEARPAVVIKEGDWDWMRMGIGDYTGVDPRDGTQFFAGYWKGTHTIFALGNKGAETRILASEIAKLLLWFQRVILDQLGLHRFIVVKIGALHALKEATENYVVPVVVAYVAEELWSIQVEAPRLKHIVFDPDAIAGLL